MTDLHELLEQSSVVVCCGSGGVGKTTTAAALALHAARGGRKVVVVTIDPARRLADALGLADGLASEPQRIDLSGLVGDRVEEASEEASEDAHEHNVEDSREDSDEDARRDNDADIVDRPVEGEMWAMMLDTAATFDGLVRRHAEDDEQIDRILTNPLYRNMAGAMSGTQEYMAAETLHALHGDDRFDLVIVDTPPSRNALDFLEAPGVLARFLSHRAFKLLMLPTKTGLKMLGPAAQPILKAIGRVVGSDVLADAVAFFQAFAGMETGFRDRADEVMALIRAPGTAFVVVASPRHDTIDEAVWFSQQLVEQGVGVGAAIINRTQPPFGTGTAAAATDRAAATEDSAVAALWTNLAELRTLRERELSVVSRLADVAGDDSLTMLPLLESDVHDLGGLQTIAGHLFGNSGARDRTG